MLAIDTIEYTFEAPFPGWAEMDPETYWQAAVDGTHRVLQRTGARPSSVQAIGFSSQGQTFVPINSAGEPIRKAVVWLDERAGEVAREWERKWLSQDLFRMVTGYPIVTPLLTVFKLAWFAQNEPEVCAAWKYLCLPDYLIYRMTSVAATDYTTAQTTGLFEIATEQWEPGFIGKAGVDLDQLPLILKPGDTAGKLSQAAAAELGLPVGVPVCVGANDQLCGAIGAGNVREGVATETTGTAMAVIATTNHLSDAPGVVVGPHPVEGLFFAMPCAITAGITLKWLRDLCVAGESYEDFLGEIDNIAIGSDGLTAMPHFCGTGSPDFNANARGAFVGLTLSHTRKHMARALMESCCCALRELLELVPKTEVVRSLGGAARSDVWLQMKADLLGVSVERPLSSDAASLGAAMLAACGTGAGSLREVSEKWYRPGRVFEPDPERTEAYRLVYERYSSLRKTLYE